MVSFRLFDSATGNTWAVDEKVQFNSDAVYGTTNEPFVLTLKSLITGSGVFESKTFVRCYPNPFNRQVYVEYSDTGESVTIDVLNADGTLVRRIFEGYPAEGKNTAVWKGNNQSGSDVAPGMYYIRFISGDSAQTVKISKTK
jgi:flagellar hook assembly protein FlgD